MTNSAPGSNPDIRICQFFELRTRNDPSTIYRYQNYFINQDKLFPNVHNGDLYQFAPFRAEGSLSSLNGENGLLRVLFPNIEYGLQLLYRVNNNRLTRLRINTMWLTANNEYSSAVFPEYYVGIGSSISETTLELRFRSAIDSVASNFPARTLTKELVGLLPLDSNVNLR
jgi:hypothetical protein